MCRRYLSYSIYSHCLCMQLQFPEFGFVHCCYLISDGCPIDRLKRVYIKVRSHCPPSDELFSLIRYAIAFKKYRNRFD